jgi:hypothetical protein
MVEVGKLPTSPMMVVGPVFVIPEPARTPKSKACPKLTGASTPETWSSVSTAAIRMRHRGVCLMIFGKELKERKAFIGRA